MESSPPPPDETVRKFDLTASQERISIGRLPALELVFERFARSLRTTLSNQLGHNVLVSSGAVETLKCGAFLKRLPLPSSLHLFRMPPLPGSALIALSTPLAFAFVELLMGGNTRRVPKMPAREFSAIETRLIGKLIGSVLNDLEGAWTTLHPLQCVFSRSEMNPLTLSLVPPTDSVAVAAIEVNVEQITATLEVCIPMSVLQPILGKLSSSVQRAVREDEEHSRARMTNHLTQTPVEVSVRLAEGSIKVRDLLALRVGDILPLSTAKDDPARVLVHGCEKFLGVVGASRGRRAVSLTTHPKDSPVRLR